MGLAKLKAQSHLTKCEFIFVKLHMTKLPKGAFVKYGEGVMRILSFD